jgi:hypothetical protein
MRSYDGAAQAARKERFVLVERKGAVGAWSATLNLRKPPSRFFVTVVQG